LKLPVLLHRLSSSASTQGEGLHDWRGRILSNILRFVAPLGALTAIPSIWLALQHGQWAIAWIDAVALVWVLWLWRYPMPYRWRAWNLIAVIYLLGVWFLSHVGPVSEIYLMAVPIMTALLLGLRPAVATLALNGVTLLALGYLTNRDLHLPGFENLPFVEWVVITINFLFINTILTIACGVLLQQLEHSLQRQTDFARTLEGDRHELQRVNTALQDSAAALNHLAYYDELTGLPNRRQLMDRLSQTLDATAEQPANGALFYLDLDRFKNINDARGHASGDTLLRTVAQRLQTLIEPQDLAARLGGDEFVVLTPRPPTDPQDIHRTAYALAQRIRQALAEPYTLDGQPYTASASVGVVIFDNAQRSAQELLRDADTAMYRAKASGRDCIAFFEDAMQQQVEARLALETALDKALNVGSEQLALHLQSQVDRLGHVVGAELLLRWTHPDLGAISPAQFIPIAEETHLILRLGDWVLEQACIAQLTLAETGRALPLSVNVSPRQFHQVDFIDRVRSVVTRTGADPRGLIFEVTEGLLIENLDLTRARMQTLVQLGIRFSIDDFGTGYSSLAYLHRLPLYELKIDRSFIKDCPADAGHTAIVQMILSMARHLGLRVVAEGVETSAQAEFLTAQGCDLQQGYLYARPQSLPDWLRTATLKAASS
jgi:diguanylate cyclase (GGDEF)-like protein